MIWTLFDMELWFYYYWLLAFPCYMLMQKLEACIWMFLLSAYMHEGLTSHTRKLKAGCSSWECPYCIKTTGSLCQIIPIYPLRSPALLYLCPVKLACTDNHKESSFCGAWVAQSLSVCLWSQCRDEAPYGAPCSVGSQRLPFQLSRACVSSLTISLCHK